MVTWVCHCRGAGARACGPGCCRGALALWLPAGFATIAEPASMTNNVSTSFYCPSSPGSAYSLCCSTAEAALRSCTWGLELIVLALHFLQAFINTARKIYEKIEQGVFDVSNEVLHLLQRLLPCIS